MGAQVFCNIGYGDDGTPNGGVFNDLDQWIENDFLPCILSGQAKVNTVTTTFDDDDNDADNSGITQKKVPKQNIVNVIRDSPKPISPYQVMLSSHKAKDNKISLDDQTSSKEEWQMQQYYESYNAFFQSLRPKNAYEYNETTGYRLSDDIQCDDDNNNSDENKGPLIGNVTSNKRLTSKEWVQDTRHISIHVTTSSIQQRAQSLSKHVSKTSTYNDELPSHHSNQTHVPLPYYAGDIATIIPSNSKTVVHKFISCLPPSIQSQVDIPLCIGTTIMQSTQYKTNVTPWPPFCTLRGLLTFCANISSLPEREDLRSLSAYCNPLHPMGVDQKAKLISLSETSDAALYGDYIIREKRNWADVLFDFDSIRYESNESSRGIIDSDDADGDDNDAKQYTKLNIEHLLMILSSIMPRHFSIASAPSSTPMNDDCIDRNESHVGYVQSMEKRGFCIDLCVAVVKGTTPHGRKYNGLCSNYLSQLGLNQSKSTAKPLDRVKLWIRPGSFRKMPLNIVTTSENLKTGTDSIDCRFETPIICIGAGTGIAPLRSLIHEREAIRNQHMHMMRTNTDSKKINNPITSKFDNILVFGCRKQNEDYYYERDWKLYSELGSLKVLLAFSQDQKHKVYVQHIIRDTNQGLLMARHILENSGAVYIAGGAKMARAVKDEIIECLGKYLPNGSIDAKKMILRLQRAGKFCVEAWS